MIRKVLVPVRGDGKGDGVLAHAAAVARHHKAHIEVVHCRSRPQDLMPFGVHLPEYLRKQIVEQSYKVADQEEAGLRAELKVLASKLNLNVSEDAIGKAETVSFVEQAGRQIDVIKQHGRLADMIVVAKPDRDRNLGHNTLKAALFHSGRPVLMCPPTPISLKKLGVKVTIAWNGSSEAARALSQCKSVLRAADTVWILSNGADSGPGTSTSDLIYYLDLHGISARLEKFTSSKNIGKELLIASTNLGADMMIMGAYGDSHERETIFGGNTQAVVDNAELPVLLNH
ncbi:MAG: universal stress protein [Tateyamaria sp.]|jgi:nucleotide-binding universal stress UspA family protein|nr:universal stress protein [Tateyamaria sp.]MBT5300843.1 universal stress protein [Tateyamaria sp.]MBT6344456.1 universal stress protein [Tateyamaria sp.]MDG0981292.1 universal stress protein [Tateyamaria sp.]MDG1419363.1 universal stress protein [Tateyamaria sp.]